MQYYAISVCCILSTREHPARHGILLREPDGFLLELLGEGLDLAAVAEAVRARAGGPGMRPMLKRAGLPRLGKALG